MPSADLPASLLDAIAAEVGTPTYVYAADAVRRQYHALTGALAGMPHRIHYSVKANSNLGVLGVLRRLGAGADIVSGGELRRVLRAGYDPSTIVFSGVGKSLEELRAAVSAGVGLINVESRAELDALITIAGRGSAPLPVGLRVNPEVTADTHPYTRTGGRGMKFGIPSDEVLEVAQAVADDPHLVLEGVGVHIGSQICEAAHYAEAASRLAGFVREVRQAGIDSLKRVDIGGGIGIRYRNERPMELTDFADAIRPLADTGLSVVLEPGRYLVGNAGLLLTRCLYVKRSGGRIFAIVDGGMNDLVRPSWYQAEHEIDIVSSPPGSADAQVVDVVGPLCETGDFLGLERELIGVAPGALLAIRDAGAYGFTMSSNYNSRPRAAEILVDGGKWSVTRRRELMDDLMRGERTLEEIDSTGWASPDGSSAAVAEARTAPSSMPR